MPDTARRQDLRAQKTAAEIIESPDFKHLVTRRWSVSMTLLVLLFVTYYGYILLIPYAPDFMTRKIGEYTTMAIPLGVAVIVIAFVLTAIYVVWANQSYDPEVARLRAQLKK